MKRIAVLIALLAGVLTLSSCNIAKGLAGASTRMLQSAGRTVGM